MVFHDECHRLHRFIAQGQPSSNLRFLGSGNVKVCTTSVVIIRDYNSVFIRVILPPFRSLCQHTDLRVDIFFPQYGLAIQIEQFGKPIPT